MKSTLTNLVLTLTLSVAFAPTAGAQEVPPKAEQPFKGRIGRTAKESTPDFPKGIEAPKGAPNVLAIRAVGSVLPPRDGANWVSGAAPNTIVLGYFRRAGDGVARPRDLRRPLAIGRAHHFCC